MKRAMFSSDLQVRQSEDEKKKYLEGYFIRFNEKTELQRDLFETIDPKAVERSINEDIVCLFNHDTAKVLGRTGNQTLKLKADEDGLFGVVEINENDKEALDIYARVSRGDINACSFGFYPIEEEVKELDDGSIEIVVKDADIKEVSIVTFPAYPTTQIEARNKQVKDMKQRELNAKKKTLLKKLKGE